MHLVGLVKENTGALVYLHRPFHMIADNTVFAYNLTQLISRLHVLLPGNLSGLSSKTVLL